MHAKIAPQQASNQEEEDEDASEQNNRARRIKSMTASRMSAVALGEHGGDNQGDGTRKRSLPMRAKSQSFNVRGAAGNARDSEVRLVLGIGGSEGSGL